MRMTRARMVLGGAAIVVVAVAIAVAIVVGTGGGGRKAATTSPATVTAGAPLLQRPELAAADIPRYKKLFASLKVGTTRIGILGKWPKPYQDFPDQFGDRCVEWKGGRVLYDLCFKNDLLVLKDPG